MTGTMVRIGRAIYRATPFPRVRNLYFTAFCRVMRDRRVRATLDGSTYDLDLGEMIDVALYVGQYEHDVTLALRRFCKPGMTVLDIGANIGAHTLPLGRLTTPSGAVYAFEPTDYAFEKLRRNLALNALPHVHPIKAALSTRNADAQAVGYRSSWTTTGGRSDNEGKADFVRLDDWAARAGVTRVDLVKIDIDGNEYEAFAGGLQLLQFSLPLIVMEAVSPHFSDPDRNPFGLLAGLGYRFIDAKSHHVDAGVAELAALFPENDRDMTTSLNVMALPPSSKD